MNLVILVLKPMKTEYEKMRSQELYYFSDPEIRAKSIKTLYWAALTFVPSIIKNTQWKKWN